LSGIGSVRGIVLLRCVVVARKVRLLTLSPLYRTDLKKRPNEH
jgi:hypothetical protein